MNDFDYIIVGVGSTGCLLANRLSEHPDNNVLLLEVGEKRRSIWLDLPVGYFKTFYDPRSASSLRSIHQASLALQVASKPLVAARELQGSRYRQLFHEN